jgi:sulfate/thiosulfate-binding protein
MSRKLFVLLASGGLALAVVVAWLRSGDSAEQHSGQPSQSLEMLNVSYDPTRELWRDLNARFIARYEQQTGTRLTISQSHAGSSSQARAVIDGLEADVVTLALWPDTEAIHRAGLINSGWEQRLPNKSVAYYSTIVFVVRKGNPRGIQDWPDLVREGVQIITPNPKTSGNGKLSFLAAWAAVLHRGGSEADARQYVSELYRHVPVLDSGARAATTTFAQKKIGDVHLTWENEAYLEVQESHGALEIVYPPVSIRAEPPVTWVDANVQRKGTAAAAEAYLRFLFTTKAQEVLAAHHYRPIDSEVSRAHAPEFPAIELVSISDLGLDWNSVNTRFFGEGGIFDAVYQSRK